MKLSPILSASVALLLAACGTDIFGEAKGGVYESSVKQADEARKSGDLDAAIPLYGRALEAHPNGIEAKLGLGQAYLSAGLADEAAAQFRDVLDKKAGNQIARRGLALALISMGQPELAERQLEAALLADGRDYRTLNAYGVVLDMMGRHAEAQARYRQGIELAPDYVPLRSNFGLSLAISRAADGRVRQNLAFAYAMNGDLENCLLVSRKDLDEQSAQRQLSYFMQLRSLPVEARSAELRRNPSFFPQSAGGA
jgi:Flp pilus assembly protein TadD